MPKQRLVQPQGLDECIPAISSSITSSRNVSTKSAKEIANLYLASMSLLYHLKDDQAKLQHHHQQGLQHRKKQPPNGTIIPPRPPSPEEIPAMTAVLQDPRLFRALLACLKPASNTSTQHNHHHHHHDSSDAAGGPAESMTSASASGPPFIPNRTMMQSSFSVPGNRKRSMSYVEHDNSNNHHGHHGPPMKSLKMVHSPTPNRSNASNSMLSFSKSDAATSSGSNDKKPHWNVPVVAACIFYAAYAHIDHWPVALVKAYAEDCFGPRCWVDAEECRLLVKNLALVHTSSASLASAPAVTKDQTSTQAATTTTTTAAGSSNDDRDKERCKEAPLAMDYFHYLETTTTSDSYFSTPTSSTFASLSPTPTPTYTTTTTTSFLRRGSLSSDAGSVTALQPRFQVTTFSNEALHSHRHHHRHRNKKPMVPSIPDDKHPSSDSDSEVPTKNSNKAKGKHHHKNNDEDDGDDGSSSSSSSGEEDEEVVAMTESFGDDGAIAASANSTNANAASVVSADIGVIKGTSDNNNNTNNNNRRSYPFSSTADGTSHDDCWYHKLDLTRIRQRYYGVNLEQAYQAISSSLLTRLDVKSKQNSGLLQALPNFCGVPAVRSLVAQQLEKWLQSPALSGLARVLFVATVNQMKHVQPPLPEDVDAIDSILRMKLKANQLNAHIENVTSIAKRIPTATVSRQIYIRLLREVLQGMESNDRTNSDHLKMLTAVHNAFPPNLSAEGLGEALLTLLAHPNEEDQPLNRPQRDKLVRKLRTILRDVASAFGASFDGCGLLEALHSFDMQVESWTMHDEEDKGRLMFQCAILSVGASPSSDSKARSTVMRGRRNSTLDEEGGGMKSRRNSNFDDDGGSRGRRHNNFTEVESGMLRKKLMHARKLLMSWCCTDYAKYCCAKADTRTTNGKRKKQDDGVGETAGMPDFRSILDDKSYDCLPSLRIMRCVLFMEFPDSPYLQQFLYPDGSFSNDDSNWNDERYQIALCCELGSCLDNEMLRMVLESAAVPNEGISESLALSLIEHLVEFCNKSHTARLLVSDPTLIKQLYELSVYSPPPKLVQSKTRDTENGSTEDNAVDKAVPRLAYPGRWWRVTFVSLALCGASPDRIGATVWQEYPTLTALIKMVTSRRYRFPTVDCDDVTRDEVKKAEASLRNEETRIAELLFLPPKVPVKTKVKAGSINSGSRVSKRQRDKQERLLRQQREKEAAEAQAEALRRKKILRSAQKTIMLWNPTGPARKPPRESVDILLSVERLFGLSETFQTVAKPDFVLGTIGNTTRGAIERAYDWLIPIISSLPDTIARLPANASCFLLLRAYGTDGGERAQLKELSKPLLVHVRDCLSGKFGLNDAIRAADLLLSDVASPKADIRRCARRVLQESIGRMDDDDIDAAFKENNCSWMLSVLKSEHADVLVGESIKHLSSALSYERGKVLRALVMALEKYYNFVADKDVTVPRTFQQVFFDLLSSRPSVCVEAMEDFPDLQSVAIRSVYGAFSSLFQDKPLAPEQNDESVSIIPYKQAESQNQAQGVLICPFQLVQSICVVLSTYSKDFRETESSSSAAPVHYLVDALLQPLDDADKNTKGLAGATFSTTGERAVAVDSWVLLAKSRSDFIAKQAALSAPANFIPRLLLCSGLPQASLQTMLDRLGKLGDQSSDKDHVFSQLLAPSATSDWDVGRFISRRDLARKLVGRLSAYGRKRESGAAEEGVEISSSFLEWLSKECRVQDKPRRKKPKKSAKVTTNVFLSNVAASSGLLEKLELGLDELQDDGMECDVEVVKFQDKKSNLIQEESPSSVNIADIETLVKNGKVESLAGWLEKEFPEGLQTNVGQVNCKNNDNNGTAKSSCVAESLLKGVLQSNARQDSIVRLVMEWIPSLTQFQGSDEFWGLLFNSDNKGMRSLLDSLLSKCMQNWSPSHVVSCRNWILSLADKEEVETNDRHLRFLILTSGQRSVNTQSFYHAAPHAQSDKGWGKSQEFVNSCSLLALKSIKPNAPLTQATAAVSRFLPDWITLLLLLASQGRNQVRLVASNILRRIAQSMEHAEEANCCSILRSALLRIYIHFPYSLDLGNPTIRSTLVDAAEFCKRDWQYWRSPLDDQISDMMEGLLNQGTPRLVQALSDLAKNHPLFILRKLSDFVRALELDAAADNFKNAVGVEKRGIIVSDNLQGPREAKFAGRIVKVTVKHWGYSYSEMVWLALLDIVLMIPKPLLFQHGLKLGVLDLFNMYVQLLFTQSQLRRTSEDQQQPQSSASLSSSRLKAKMTAVFAMWKESNAVSWEDWLASKVTGLEGQGATRSVLVAADLLSPQEAIESLRSRSKTI